MRAAAQKINRAGAAAATLQSALRSSWTNAFHDGKRTGHCRAVGARGSHDACRPNAVSAFVEMQRCPKLVILGTTMVRYEQFARVSPDRSIVRDSMSKPIVLDGAARLSYAKKFVESRLLPMLRMLLAFALRWIIPGLELKSRVQQRVTNGEFKNKTIQG